MAQLRCCGRLLDQIILICQKMKDESGSRIMHLFLKKHFKNEIFEVYGPDINLKSCDQVEFHFFLRIIIITFQLSHTKKYARLFFRALVTGLRLCTNTKPRGGLGTCRNTLASRVWIRVSSTCLACHILCHHRALSHYPRRSLALTPSI